MAPGASFDDLEIKYKHFKAPEMEIIIGGDSSVLENMAIEWVDVEQTIEPQADIVRILITNPFVLNETRMLWLGSQIVVGNTMQVKMGYADKKGLLFDGLITGYTLEYPSDGSPNIIVTAMDRSFLLMKSSHSSVWADMKDSDVVQQIAGKYGLSTDIDATTNTKSQIEQIGVSDYHFIRSLALDNDRHFYVSASKLYFKKPTVLSPVVTLKYGKNLRSFSLHVDVSGQVSEVKVRGYDVAKKQSVEANASKVTAIGSKASTGPSLASKISSNKVEIVYTQVASQAEAQSLATAMLERKARDLVNGIGTSIGLPEIKPGEMITIEGLGDGKFASYTLRITKATHRMDAQNGYLTHFEAEGNAI